MGVHLCADPLLKAEPLKEEPDPSADADGERGRGGDDGGPPSERDRTTIGATMNAARCRDARRANDGGGERDLSDRRALSDGGRHGSSARAGEWGPCLRLSRCRAGIAKYHLGSDRTDEPRGFMEATRGRPLAFTRHGAQAQAQAEGDAGGRRRDDDRSGHDAVFPESGGQVQFSSLNLEYTEGWQTIEIPLSDFNSLWDLPVEPSTVGYIGIEIWGGKRNAPITFRIDNFAIID